MDLSNKIVSHISNGNQEFLQFKKLQKYSDMISHAYSIGIDRNYRTFKANKMPLPKEDYEKNMNDYKSLCKANNLEPEKQAKGSLNVRLGIELHNKAKMKSVEKNISINELIKQAVIAYLKAN